MDAQVYLGRDMHDTPHMCIALMQWSQGTGGVSKITFQVSASHCIIMCCGEVQQMFKLFVKLFVRNACPYIQRSVINQPVAPLYACMPLNSDERF
jgi:hypothetical protein